MEGKIEGPKKSSSFKLGILVVLVFILLACVSILLTNLEKPTSGTVVRIASSTNSDSTSTKMYVQIGKTVIYKYPSFFNAVPAQTVSSPTIERYDYIKLSSVTWQLNIEVSSLPSGGIDNFSSYTIRANNPSEYQLTTKSNGAQNYTITTDTSSPSFNQVAFLVHNNYIATIALNGGTSVDESTMQSSLMSIIDSWRWIN